MTLLIGSRNRRWFNVIGVVTCEIIVSLKMKTANRVWAAGILTFRILLSGVVNAGLKKVFENTTGKENGSKNYKYYH